MKFDLRLRKISCFLFMIAIMSVIFFFSAQPAQTSEKVSTTFTEKLVSPFTPIPPHTKEERDQIVRSLHNFIRKCAHFSLYAVLGIAVLSFVGCYKPYQVAAPVSGMICLLYSVSDEFHQRFVDGRGAQVKDVAIDFCGALTGIAFLLLCIWIFKFWRKKRAQKVTRGFN